MGGQCMAPCSGQKYGADCAQACTGSTTAAKKKTNCAPNPTSAEVGRSLSIYFFGFPGLVLHPILVQSADKQLCQVTCTTCKAGFYGDSSASHCGPAVMGKFAKSSGELVSCDPCAAGYNGPTCCDACGDDCTQSCSGQKWAANCEETCVAPDHCDADGGWECHSTTGDPKSCDTCAAGFAGARHMWPPDHNLFLIF
jgi:hypothetical protein